MRVWERLAHLLCGLIGHPPSTWGNTKLEEPILAMYAEQRPDDERLSVHVSCLGGCKMVPFKAKPLEVPRITTFGYALAILNIVLIVYVVAR